MRLAASQIGWAAGDETRALEILRGAGFGGLEIAPPRVAGETPYAKPEAAAEFAAQMRREHGLALCSMQSIWFGKQGSIFGPEREDLLDYTKKAIRFAEAGGIRNLVFGSPKNRVLPEGVAETAADSFFAAIGEYAAAHGVVIGMEANPPVYGTNFINATPDAFALAQRVNSPGFMVNLDIGTIITNNEDADFLKGNIKQVSHVHVSEPGLAMIEPRGVHRQIAAILRDEGYAGYVSIEMKAQPVENVEKAAAYVAEVFG